MKKNMVLCVVAVGLAGTTFSTGGPALEALSGDRLTREPDAAAARMEEAWRAYKGNPVSPPPPLAPCNEPPAARAHVRVADLAGIPITSAPNRFTRNIVEGMTVARGNGQDAVFCGNVGFNAPPAPERLAALKFLDPLPPESAIGPRPDDPFLKQSRAVFNGLR